MSDLDETKKRNAEQGIDNAFGALNNNSTSWIMQTMLEAGPTVDPIPDNVVCVNPIVSSVVPAFEQDPDFVEWLIWNLEVFSYLHVCNMLTYVCKCTTVRTALMRVSRLPPQV